MGRPRWRTPTARDRITPPEGIVSSPTTRRGLPVSAALVHRRSRRSSLVRWRQLAGLGGILPVPQRPGCQQGSRSGQCGRSEQAAGFGRVARASVRQGRPARWLRLGRFRMRMVTALARAGSILAAAGSLRAFVIVLADMRVGAFAMMAVSAMPAIGIDAAFGADARLPIRMFAADEAIAAVELLAGIAAGHLHQSAGLAFVPAAVAKRHALAIAALLATPTLVRAHSAITTPAIGTIAVVATFGAHPAFASRAAEQILAAIPLPTRTAGHGAGLAPFLTAGANGNAFIAAAFFASFAIIETDAAVAGTAWTLVIGAALARPSLAHAEDANFAGVAIAIVTALCLLAGALGTERARSAIAIRTAIVERDAATLATLFVRAATTADAVVARSARAAIAVVAALLAERDPARSRATLEPLAAAHVPVGRRHLAGNALLQATGFDNDTGSGVAPLARIAAIGVLAALGAGVPLPGRATEQLVTTGWIEFVLVRQAGVVLRSATCVWRNAGSEATFGHFGAFGDAQAAGTALACATIVIGAAFRRGYTCAVVTNLAIATVAIAATFGARAVRTAEEIVAARNLASRRDTRLPHLETTGHAARETNSAATLLVRIARVDARTEATVLTGVAIVAGAALLTSHALPGDAIFAGAAIRIATAGRAIRIETALATCRATRTVLALEVIALDDGASVLRRWTVSFATARPGARRVAGSVAALLVRSTETFAKGGNSTNTMFTRVTIAVVGTRCLCGRSIELGRYGRPAQQATDQPLDRGSPRGSIPERPRPGVERTIVHVLSCPLEQSNEIDSAQLGADVLDRIGRILPVHDPSVNIHRK